MIKGGTNMEFSIITLIIGILGFVLGFMVRKYKMGNLVSWVNLKKYDNDKVADIMGSHGIWIMFISNCWHKLCVKKQVSIYNYNYNNSDGSCN